MLECTKHVQAETIARLHGLAPGRPAMMMKSLTMPEFIIHKPPNDQEHASHAAGDFHQPETRRAN